MSLQLEAKRCFIKIQRELLLYERMKYIVSAKISLVVLQYTIVILTGGKVCTHNIVSESARVPSKTKPAQIRCEFIIENLRYR